MSGIVNSTGAKSGIIGTTFPAGMIIGSAQAIYEWTGDLMITSTSEAFGPVASFQLKKANAKLYATYNCDEILWNGENLTFNVVYKSSSFTAGTGNTTHGAAYLNQNNVIQFRPLGSGGDRRAGDVIVNVHNTHSIGNSAGETYWFSPEAHTLSAGSYPNDAGAISIITFNIMEIS